MPSEDRGVWGDDDIIAALVDLKPIRFEHFIADLWAQRGWETNVTDGSGDRGIDVVATQSFPYEKKALIQAKRYKSGNNVSGPEVQKYASLKQRGGVDEVVIVTTSRFTSQAIELCEEFNLKPVNREKLVEIIDAASAEGLVREYAGVLDACPSCSGDVGSEDEYCTQCGEHLQPHRAPTIEITHHDETTIPASGQVDEKSETVVISVRGNEIRGEVGESFGREVRRVMIEEGASREEARRIHREHIRFTREDTGVVVEVLGENPTRLNNQVIGKGEKRKLQPGDVIELSNTVRLEVEQIV